MTLSVIKQFIEQCFNSLRIFGVYKKKQSISTFIICSEFIICSIVSYGHV